MALRIRVKQHHRNALALLLWKTERNNMNRTPHQEKAARIGNLLLKRCDSFKLSFILLAIGGADECAKSK